MHDSAGLRMPHREALLPSSYHFHAGQASGYVLKLTAELPIAAKSVVKPIGGLSGRVFRNK